MSRLIWSTATTDQPQLLSTCSIDIVDLVVC